MQTTLAALKDISGVIGSFVLTPQGALAGRNMPEVYQDSIFPEMGRRLATIAEVSESQIGATRELIMKFEGSWLFVRRTAECLLSVVAAENVNLPALRMATNVAIKQIIEQMPKLEQQGASTSVSSETAPVEQAATPAPAPAAPAPSKPRRMWRGQWVD